MMKKEFIRNVANTEDKKNVIETSIPRSISIYNCLWVINVDGGSKYSDIFFTFGS
jgi:hypothetical protein